MRIEQFTTAIEKATNRPKAVKISPDFWKLLENSNLIQIKNFDDTDIQRYWFSSKSPFYGGDIYLIYSQELLENNIDFELPPASCKLLYE